MKITALKKAILKSREKKNKRDSQKRKLSLKLDSVDNLSSGYVTVEDLGITENN